MKVYVCPVCDHAMRGRHYCGICHQFVKSPYYIDKNYSLDRMITEPNVCNDKHTEDNKKMVETNVQPKRRSRESKKITQIGREKVGKYRAVCMIIAVYILFQVSIIIFSNIPKSITENTKIKEWFSEEQKQERIDVTVGEDELAGDWIYETPDNNEIIKIGEESTGFTHFAVDGQKFLNEFWKTLNDADFEAVEQIETDRNYIATNSEQGETYTYFEKLRTFYLTDDYTEYYRLSEDFVSGRLINTEIESRDYDRVRFYTEAAVSFLLPDNKRKQNKMEQLETYLEKLLGEENYFSENIGTIIVSGYVYPSSNGKENMYHISLSRTKNE